MKMKNVNVLKDLNIRENWLINNILYRKIKYFGHNKRHSSLEAWFQEDEAGAGQEEGGCQMSKKP
jgi:hypothetical protein